MPNEIRYNYYRIYDDKEQFNYIKSTFGEEAIRKLLKDFEHTHAEYYNTELLRLLKQHDPEAEIIDVKAISY